MIYKALKYLRNVLVNIYKGINVPLYMLREKKWKNFLQSNKEFYFFNYKNIFRIKLYRDSELSQYIFKKVFEKNETRFIASFLKKGDTFIDIGTNIGFFSLLAGKKIKDTGRVYSFEPTSETFNRLLENININKLKNIKPIKQGLSDQIGNLEIYKSLDGYDAWNSFAKPICGEKYEKELVPISTFDNFVYSEDLNDKIDLIKIDVEGWEKFVLLGGNNFFRNNNSSVILIEFVDLHMKNVGYDGRELYEILNKYGYKLFSINNHILVQEGKRDFYNYCNLVACKDAQILRRKLNWWIILEEDSVFFRLKRTLKKF